MSPKALGCALLLGACLWGRAGHAVVAARSTEDAEPRIESHSVSPPAAACKVVALLPLADAPRSPGSGRLATDALRQALEARGILVVEAAPANDASGKPTPPHLVSGSALARIGAAAGADAAAAGRVLELYTEVEGRPRAVTRKRGVWADVPAEERIASRVALTVRVIDSRTRKLVYAATGRLGPVYGVEPGEALSIVGNALLDRWLGKPAP